MASSIFLALCNYGQLTIVTRYLDLFNVGIFTLALAISNPLFQFFNLQLRSVLVTDRNRKFLFDEYFTLRIISTIAVMIIGLSISLIKFDLSANSIVFILIFLSYGLDALIDIFNAEQHYHQKFTTIAFSSVLRGSAGILGIVIGLVFFDNFLIALNLVLILKLISFFTFDYRIHKKANLTARLVLNKNILRIVNISVSLGFTLLIVSLNVNLSKYFVEWHYGTEIQGSFSTMSYLVVIGTLFVATVGQILLPKLAIFYNNAQFDLLRRINYGYIIGAVFLGVTLWLISIPMGSSLITFLFSEKVISQSEIFPNLMFSAIFIYCAATQGYALTSIRRLHVQPFICGLSLIVNLILNLFYGSSYGIKGIIYFTGISFFLQFFVSFIIFELSTKTTEKPKV